MTVSERKEIYEQLLLTRAIINAVIGDLYETYPIEVLKHSLIIDKLREQLAVMAERIK